MYCTYGTTHFETVLFGNRRRQCVFLGNRYITHLVVAGGKEGLCGDWRACVVCPCGIGVDEFRLASQLPDKDPTRGRGIKRPQKPLAPNPRSSPAQRLCLWLPTPLGRQAAAERCMHFPPHHISRSCSVVNTRLRTSGSTHTTSSVRLIKTLLPLSFSYCYNCLPFQAGGSSIRETINRYIMTNSYSGRQPGRDLLWEGEQGGRGVGRGQKNRQKGGKGGRSERHMDRGIEACTRQSNLDRIPPPPPK